MNADNISKVLSNLSATLKSTVKIALNPHPSRVTPIGRNDGNSIIIMGNGPSFAKAMTDHADILRSHPALAVNFFGNTPEYTAIKPGYYVLVDPAFFTLGHDPAIDRLIKRIDTVTDWPMTLYIPRSGRKALPPFTNPNLKVEDISINGVEGFEWFEDWAFRHRLGTPRPRNVLIPSIMQCISLGFKNIYLTGADHTWAVTLSVNEQNQVVSVQPHFYKEDEEHLAKNREIFLGCRIHEVYNSYSVAFKAYHTIERYARRHGVNIYNATAGSFIDAFRRRPLTDIALPPSGTTPKQ